ncbi:MAG: glucose-6-phosphate isomerase [Verrucomicrobia bacterium]|nr:glucose-6-phosphate isomerase [Verrucomicrobiota bacterium]
MSSQAQNVQAFQKAFLDAAAFDQTMAYNLLLQLATQPIDLTQDGVLTPERIHKFKASQAGYTLLYGFERVTEQVMQALFDLAHERNVLDQMECMQQGEVVNFITGFDSERRAALHTATRDIFEPHQTSAAALSAREASLAEHKKLKKFLSDIELKNNFNEMIFIGIGGSELGPSALYQSLAFYTKPGRKVHFIGNVDPDDVSLVIKEADLAKSLVVVISKSGTTLETETNEEYLRDAFTKRGLRPEAYFVSVTMPKTPMDNPEKYVECFYLWDYVGGRYSSTSMVGGVLIGFTCGYEVFYELCKGAHEMDLVALQKDVKQNLPLIGALLGVWNRNFLHYPTVAVIPYSRMLKRFPAHLQQCDMESNGKRVDRKANVTRFQTGPIIWGEPGTNAQHSFFQLIHQGTNIVPLEIIGFVQSQGPSDFEYQGTTSQEKLLSNLFAQAIALAKGQKSANPNKVFPGNRPTSLIMAKKLTPHSLGALLAYYEHKIAFQGFIWGINSFDQEGVQLGKQLANKCLNLFAFKRLSTAAEKFPLGEALIEISEEV